MISLEVARGVIEGNCEGLDLPVYSKAGKYQGQVFVKVGGGRFQIVKINAVRGGHFYQCRRKLRALGVEVEIYKVEPDDHDCGAWCQY